MIVYMIVKVENTEKLVGFINYNSSNLSVSHVLGDF